MLVVVLQGDHDVGQSTGEGSPHGRGQDGFGEAEGLAQHEEGIGVALFSVLYTVLGEGHLQHGHAASLVVHEVVGELAEHGVNVFPVGFQSSRMESDLHHDALGGDVIGRRSVGDFLFLEETVIDDGVDVGSGEFHAFASLLWCDYFIAA